jgi:uncharacterized protein YdeI (YjbR/CyaY-like superfamily)
MSKQTTPEILHFLDSISAVSHENYEIISSIREKVLDSKSNVSETIKYGGLIFIFKNKEVAGLFAYKNHVSFEFGEGFKFSDPENLLRGQGKYRRHLRFESVADVDDPQVEYFIRQMFDGGA